MTARWISAAALAAATWSACGGESPSDETAADPVNRAPRLPANASKFAPSQVDIAGGGDRAGAEIADVERCAPCHQQVVEAWRSSAHASASFNNPLYRVSVDGFRADSGNEKSRFCGGCHDPALLVDGAMDVDVEADDPRARAGVTCSVCHTVVEARPGGNASYTLGAEPLPIPSMNDPASIALHRERAAPAPLRTAALCATCHKAFLGDFTGHPFFISGQDDALPWRRSAFAGSRAERIDEPVEQAECRHCHMAPEEPTEFDVSAADGAVASHAFTGAHTLLAAMRRDEAKVRRTADFLRGVARIDVAVARTEGGDAVVPAERLDPEPGTRVEFDVVVRNLGVGHMFPGGTIDLQDTWVEAVVTDASGRVVAEAGTEHEETSSDPTAHRLRLELVDEGGLPIRAHEVELFRAVAYNHAVPAREAAVVTYAFDVPADGAFAPPLSIAARLRHRARTPEIHDGACRDLASPRGQAFAAVSPIDPCARAPVVEISKTRVVLGSGAPPAGAPPAAERFADHGQGMLRAVQEELHLARPSLEAALASAVDGGDDRGAARALALLGELAGKQGRPEDALDFFDRAERLAPGHPALANGRGKALAQVWRFDEAVPHFARAAEGAPKDDLVWASLAMALGSARRPDEAYAAALKGLALSPRHPDLLRSQALALRHIAPGAAATDEANEVHLFHRVADEAPALRALCGAKVPGCADERKPVHVHDMRRREDGRSK